MTCDAVREAVEAFIDEELDGARAVEVQAHLESCAACAELRGALNRLRTDIRANAPYYQAPRGLEAGVRAALRRDSEQAGAGHPGWWWVAAGVAVAAALVVGLFLGRRNPSEDRLIAHEIVADHIRSLLPGHLMDVPSSDRHTVKPWFAGKVDFSPRVLDLSASGYPLRGGRLDYLDGRTVAALVFQRRQHIVNLFVWPQSNNARPAGGIADVNGFNLVHWDDGGLAYWAVSDVDKQDLREFARLYARK